MSARLPITRAAGEGEKRSFAGGGIHTWKLKTDDTEDAFFLFEDVMVAGKSTPLHAHPEADETAYIIEGEILHRAGDHERRVSTGGLTFTPRGTPHAFIVLSERAHILTFQTPGIGQAFYYGASDAATDDTADVVDIARLQAWAKENPRGIQILGPPPFQTADVR